MDGLGLRSEAHSLNSDRFLSLHAYEAKMIREELSSIRPEHLFPVCVLFGIFFLSLAACLFDCWRERHRQLEELSFQGRPLPQIKVTDGNTGEERIVTAH
ncbi:unnamed protein product [Cylicocyclus nassatus]|uniref:Uncharacterized protein n=1 Tax=Cylicocyclus nassatus TaxID=53992 RepID=A0AA36H2J8_CYLNA|nr:unnamed protein product [Cylicocyclus nassatus]